LSVLRKKTSRRLLLVVTVLLFALLQIEGCYYVQAIRGQLEVMSARQPIPEVIADEGSPGELRQRLVIVQEARDFAVDELLLPDNKSYRTYADLERDYVVWNVFASDLRGPGAGLRRLECLRRARIFTRAENVVLSGGRLRGLPGLLRGGCRAKKSTGPA